MKRRLRAAALAVTLIIFAEALSGCGIGTRGKGVVETLPEAVPLSESLPAFTILIPTAPGVAVEQNDKAMIDYSNVEDGYVMARYTENTSKKIKVIVDGPSGAQYTYSLNTDGNYAVFPLSDGNGSYKIGVYEQTAGMKYAVVVTAAADVNLADEFSPFLRPNQYVNYSRNSAVVRKAAELIRGADGLTGRIAAVYNYVVDNISYDHELAQTVQSGYIPDLDAVLEREKGICFDYASVMTAMLRSQGIPTKLIFGYTGDAYHAWISVYSEETGWVDNVIFFDGQTWKLMDPTFASSGGQSSETMKYIGDGSNYIAKYQY